LRPTRCLLACCSPVAVVAPSVSGVTQSAAVTPCRATDQLLLLLLLLPGLSHTDCKMLDDAV